MKIAANKLESYVNSPPKDVRAHLVYGPDQGKVKAVCDALIDSTGVDPHDAFNFVEITGAELKKNPEWLEDNLQAFGLGGGHRVVLITAAVDGCTAIIKPVLESIPDDTTLIVRADELTAQSSLRKLFETSKSGAASLACYLAEGQGLSFQISNKLRECGKSISRDALGYMQSSLGNDHLITMAEVEKLVLYVGDRSEITLEDAEACIINNAENQISAITHAVGEGNKAALDKSLHAAYADSVMPIVVLRALHRHLSKLYEVHAICAELGVGTQQAVEKLRPPVFWKDKDRMIRQANRWSTKRLKRALELIYDEELACKLSPANPELQCAYLLGRLAG